MGPCPAGMSRSVFPSKVLVLGVVVIPLWALKPRVPSGCEDLPSLFLFQNIATVVGAFTPACSEAIPRLGSAIHC